MAFNEIQQHPYISVLLSPHQRSFLHWIINWYPQVDNGQRVKDFGVPSPKWIFLSNPWLKGSGIYAERGRKIVKARPQAWHAPGGRGECQTNWLHPAALLALAPGDHPHLLHPQRPGSIILPANPHDPLLYLLSPELQAPPATTGRRDG